MVNVHEFPRPPIPSSSRTNGNSPMQNGHSSPPSDRSIPNGHSSSPLTTLTSNGRSSSHEPMDAHGDDWDSEGEEEMDVEQRKVVVHGPSHSIHSLSSC